MIIKAKNRLPVSPKKIVAGDQLKNRKPRVAADKQSIHAQTVVFEASVCTIKIKHAPPARAIASNSY
jgi:hypothetical protein